VKAVTDGMFAASNNKVFDAMVEVQELARARGRIEEQTAIRDRLEVALTEADGLADDAETINPDCALPAKFRGRADGLRSALQLVEELSTK